MSSYPPSEIPTFSYVYPAPSTVSDYLRMTSARDRIEVERAESRHRPLIDSDDLPLGEGNDFA